MHHTLLFKTVYEEAEVSINLEHILQVNVVDPYTVHSPRRIKLSYHVSAGRHSCTTTAEIGGAEPFHP